MSPLRFRIATPEDAPKVQALVQSAYRGESSRKGWTTEADLLSGTRISTEGIIEKITAPGSVVILAFSNAATDSEKEEEDLIACCELLQKDSESAYFGMFAVDPNRQAGGYGRLVLSHAEEYCSKIWGIKRLEMVVIFTREELIGWYVRRGYVRTGKRKEFPYELVKGAALRNDLYFEILEKDLSGKEVS